MTAKVNVLTAAPTTMKAWMGASLAIEASLEPNLIELVKIRASQINGCANCINMHATEARSRGETEQRIYLLSAWRGFIYTRAAALADRADAARKPHPQRLRCAQAQLSDEDK